MFLKPTNVPLTVKDFDTAKCGICSGCGCSCGYIAYLKEDKLVDLYGHPHDPNGIGSLCTKGITLIQELVSNPLRLKTPLIKDGDIYREISRSEAKAKALNMLRGKVGVFLDRFTDLRDYLSLKGKGWEVFSDSLYLPFKSSTLKPQEWREQKVIVAFECETVFSEVMATRWLVDAFERSAYIVSVSSRYGTTSAKAKRRLLLKPPLVVKFLRELSRALEGEEPSTFREDIETLSKLLSTVKESLILIGESLLRSPWRENILLYLQRIRRKLKVNYSIVGNITPFESKELKDFLSSFHEFDSLLLTGNPALFMDEQSLNKLGGMSTTYVGFFPNLTANYSKLLLPAKLFAERDFTAFRNGFGLVAESPQVLTPPEGAFSPWELVGDPQDKNPIPSQSPNLPLIEETDTSWQENYLEEDRLYLMCDTTLVDEIGHWNVWTHDIEKEQKAYISRETAKALGVKDKLTIGETELSVEISSNIAKDVVFVPSSFEEMQPFNPGVRVGRLMNEPYLRIERLKVK